LLTQVLPERRRHHPHRFQQSPSHTQETDLQRQSDLEGRATALLDHPPLIPGKREERLDLKVAQITRQTSPPQPRRLPVVHVLDLPAGRHHCPPGSRTATI
jgi:hypothetical protein